jgi:hypothetical protein
MRFKEKPYISYKGLPVLRTKIYAWESNGAKDLTRAPMFSKSLPFNNDTSNCTKKVVCNYKMGLYLRHMNCSHRNIQMCTMDS